MCACMKRLVTVFAALCLACMGVVVPQVQPAQAAESVALPFTLGAPSSASMTKAEGDSPTTMQFTYTMPNSMVEWMALGENDYDAQRKTIADLGYDDMWINSQVDWAVDDPVNGWHYNEYWDTDGVDADYAVRLGPWDAIENLVYSTTVNNAWIMRGISEDDWNGYDSRIGLKDQLKVGQYTITKTADGDMVLSIDYGQHTVYARARFEVTVRKPDVDEDIRIFSDWSPTASWGKDATAEPLTKEKLPAPAVSNLRMTDEEFNGNPVVAYDLAVSEELAARTAQVEAAGGRLIIEMEARIKGKDEWTRPQGEWMIKSGEMRNTLLQLASSKYAVEGENDVECRWHFYCEQRDPNTHEAIGEPFYSEYSPILTLEKVVLHPPVDNPGTGGEGEDEVAPSKDVSAGTDGDAAGAYITDKVSTDTDLKGSSFGTLKARATKVTGNTIKVQWTAPKKAKRFSVFGNKCGKDVNGQFNKYVKLTDTETAKTTSVTYGEVNGDAVLPNTYYKFIVVALDADNRVVASSKTIHVATSGGTYTNAKSVTVAKKANKGKLTLKKGKSFKLKAKAVKANKKLTWKNHRAIKYETSNKKVATVSSKGVIRAKKKGSATIYAYAQNGIFKKVTVKVK